MNRRTISLTVLVIASLLFISTGAPAPAGAQEPVAVHGQVVNGTQGGKVASGMAMFLHTFQEGSSRVSSRETTTDDSGGFHFENIIPTGDIGYAVTMDYAGMRYSTLIGPDDLDGPVTLVVYETTQDVSIIKVDQQALIITNVDEQERLIEAAEFVSLTNGSDRTLLPDLSNVGPGQFSFLRFSLPPGATDFDIKSDLVGGEVIPVGTGFALTSPVAPGEHNISFTFKSPYQGTSFSYRQNLPQGAEVYQVLLPQRLGQIQVSHLEPIPPLDVEGSVYRVWEGRNFSPGQGLAVELTNLPQPSLLVRWGRAVISEGFWYITIPASLGVALAFILVYGLLKAPRVADVVTPASEVLSNNGNAARRQALVRSIAVLDEKFQHGQVPEEEYQSQRLRLKEQVFAVSTPDRDISHPGETC